MSMVVGFRWVQHRQYEYTNCHHLSRHHLIAQKKENCKILINANVHLVRQHKVALVTVHELKKVIKYVTKILTKTTDRKNRQC